ncbi:DUF4145 domain-containing protein [Klebsiella pneumoniae]
MSKYFFINTCPKCKKTAPIDITKWKLGTVSFNDGKEKVTELSGVVYFTLFCKSCEQGIAGLFDYGINSGHPHDLQQYDAKGDGDLSNFFSHIYNRFRFDIPPFHRAGIYNEAMFCYCGGAYNAAVTLCRTAIDMRVNLMWGEFKQKNKEKTKEDLKDNRKFLSLYEKIKYLFPENEHSLESNISNIIRIIGNESAHEGNDIKKEDAELWLKLTEKFLSKTDKFDPVFKWMK